MKTALVYPYYKGLFTGCNPPVSLLYLASALQQADQEVFVLDIDEDHRSFGDILDLLKEISPDLVGIPLYTLVLAKGYEFVKFISQEKVPWKILIGGPHATIRPDEALDEFEACDYVLRGESEKSIVELISRLESGKSLDNVKGLSFRKGGQNRHNPDAEFITELDEIPFPARDVLKSAYEKQTYWRLGHRGTTDFIITSRGCPYDCNFCFRLSKKFRTRSPENIIAELKDLKSRGIHNVHIMDDLFVWNKPRFMKIVDLIKQEDLQMQFKVRARVNFIDEEMLQAMKQAGVKSVVYGIESGSQKILDAMNKRTTVAMNYKAISMTKKAGLQCYADMFLGYPGETLETISETENLIMKARPTAINLSVMYPLPGTRVYNEAKENGTLRRDWNVQGSYAWIQLPWVEQLIDLFKIRKRIVRKFLLHPVVIWNGLRATLGNIDFRQSKLLLQYFFKIKEF